MDASGQSWRCPVCGFDNRPRCKHCDLCGISSEFAEVRSSVPFFSVPLLSACLARALVLYISLSLSRAAAKSHVLIQSNVTKYKRASTKTSD